MGIFAYVVFGLKLRNIVLEWPSRAPRLIPVASFNGVSVFIMYSRVSHFRCGAVRRACAIKRLAWWQAKRGFMARMVDTQPGHPLCAIHGILARANPVARVVHDLFVATALVATRLSTAVATKGHMLQRMGGDAYFGAH